MAAGPLGPKLHERRRASAEHHDVGATGSRRRAARLARGGPDHRPGDRNSPRAAENRARRRTVFPRALLLLVVEVVGPFWTHDRPPGGECCPHTGRGDVDRGARHGEPILPGRPRTRRLPGVLLRGVRASVWRGLDEICPWRRHLLCSHRPGLDLHVPHGSASPPLTCNSIR